MLKRPPRQVLVRLLGKGLAIGLLGAIFLGSMLWLGASQVPELSVWKPEASRALYDRDGQLLRLYTNSDGNWNLPADSRRIDPNFISELLAYEDHRFYQHAGVDPLATLRAAGQFLINGRVISGASTITMQTIRLLHPKSRTLKNKLIEMVQALRLERDWSKKQILDLYLTLAPYGGNLQGLRAATRFYFDKEPNRLTPSERSLLIALPQSPAARRPDKHPERAKHARLHVLSRMRDYQMLAQEDLELADQQPIPHTRRKAPMTAAHLGDRLKHALPQQSVLRSRLDGTLQKQLEEMALVWQQQQEEGVTLAAMVVNHRQSEVLGYVGSGDYLTAGQLDLVTAVRSPGSTLKPFVYGLGFELGLIHPQTRVLDRPRWIGVYGPRNFDTRYHGEVSIHDALLRSLNTPAVLALKKVGAQRLYRRLVQFGVTPRLPIASTPGLPLALGGAGVTLEELTRLYAALASGGRLTSLAYSEDHSSQASGRLLDGLASWYLDDILRQAKAPDGYPDGMGIRFKTGTSYGFRDAWAIGYAGDYTAGIWVGRPDGGYHGEVTGLSGAAPILFRVFDLLGVRGSRQSPPADALLVNQRQLPPALRWLGEGVERLAKGNPSIRFPLEGSEALIAEEGNDNRLPLMVVGGQPPYSWLVDGLPVASEVYQGHTDWSPTGMGHSRITVIDTAGATDSVTVWVARDEG